MSWEVANPELNPPTNTLENMPATWDGHTKESKVQIILDVTEDNMRLVRNGEFNEANAKQVAALALEGQMTLSDFYADSEAAAKNAKHIAEYIEAEVCAELVKKAIDNKEKRPAEAALKRLALVSEKVKEAKQEAVDLEKEFKKWRCVMEILKEAHVFFRKLSSD